MRDSAADDRRCHVLILETSSKALATQAGYPSGKKLRNRKENKPKWKSDVFGSIESASAVHSVLARLRFPMGVSRGQLKRFR